MILIDCSGLNTHQRFGVQSDFNFNFNFSDSANAGRNSSFMYIVSLLRIYNKQASEQANHHVNLIAKKGWLM